MLHLIFGHDGTGKTTSLREDAYNCALSGKEVLFIVPEQCSFSAEKYFYNKKDCFSIKVSSFERINKKIFGAFGKASLSPISAPEKSLLMWRALSENADILKVTSSALKNAESIKCICEFSDMLSSFGISPSEFYKMVPSENKKLKEKAEDLLYILESYEALSDGRFLEDTGSIITAVNLLREKGNADIFPQRIIFDEFWYFTGEQLQLIKYFLEAGKEVYISVPAPDEEIGEDFGVFSLPRLTHKKLISLCSENGFSLATERVMNEDKKHQSEGLKNLALSYLGDGFNVNGDGVEVLECPDGYSEALFVAAKINELVRSEGYNYSDFAVASSNPELYKEGLKDAFKKYSVPFWRDEKAPLSLNKITSFARLFLETAKNPTPDGYIAILKSGFASFSDEEAALLEEYSFIWDLKGREWERDFTLSPFGYSFDKKDEEAEREKLEELNRLRRRLVCPVLSFRKAASDLTGDKATEILYKALYEDYNIPGKLSEAFENDFYKTPEGIIEAEKESAVLDAFSSMLDKLHSILTGAFVSLEDYISLFSVYSSLLKVGSVPQQKDAVIVSEPGRIRNENVKVFFMIGANEGEFPRSAVSSPLFNRREKEILKRENCDFIKTAEDVYLEELFTVYKTLMLPTEKLFITYPVRSFSGDEAVMSEAVSYVLSIFEKEEPDKFTNLKKDMFLLSKEGAFYLLSHIFNEKSPLREALVEYFENSPEKEKLKSLGLLDLTASDTVSDKSLLMEKLPDNMRISASKTETFHKCRFMYFCKYTLGINPPKKAELSRDISGTLIHYVLEVLIDKFSKGDLKRENVAVEVGNLVDEVIREHIPIKEGAEPRFARSKERIKKRITILVERMLDEFMQSEFKPSDFELKMDNSELIEPYSFLVNGKRVIIEGSVDRVDLLEKDGETYIRVVDYKSGKKQFKLSEVLEGINMQMLIYLVALYSGGKGKYKNSMPAGILYMPAGEAPLQKGRNSSKEDIEKTVASKYQMNGLLLEDEEVLKCMEKGLDGRFIPVTINKKGEIKPSSLASLREFGLIKKHIDKTLRDMAKDLMGSDPSILPIEDSDEKRPCSYCEYRDICGADSNTPAKKILKDKNDLRSKERLEELYGERLD